MKIRPERFERVWPIMSNTTTTTTTTGPTVQTPCGVITGLSQGTVNRFLGIPYAQAARFKAPTPTGDRTEVFHAIKPGNICPQPHDPITGVFSSKSITDGLVQSEDCQVLSVTVPASALALTTSDGAQTVSDKKRVMVWFHGGAFVNGAGESTGYDPSRLVTENDVIVVNVTSRLGIFGYLGDGGDTRPANLGLLDCVEALRWVRRNIGSFGGDDEASKITIFGQSAGGSTVSDLIYVDEATNLFGRVICQSAPFGITRNRSKLNTVLFEGVKNVDASTSQEEVVKLTQAVIKKGGKEGNGGEMAFAPQYGFAPLPAEDRLDAVIQSKAKNIDMLVGYTIEEASLFIPIAAPGVNRVTKLPIVGNMVQNGIVGFVSKKLYFDATAAYVKKYAQAGGKTSFYKLVWKKHGHRLGATHAVEIPLLFGQPDTWKTGSMMSGVTDWDAQVEQYGKRLRKMWADFAKGRQLTEQDSVDDLIHIEVVKA